MDIQQIQFVQTMDIQQKESPNSLVITLTLLYIYSLPTSRTLHVYLFTSLRHPYVILHLSNSALHQKVSLYLP